MRRGGAPLPARLAPAAVALLAALSATPPARAQFLAMDEVRAACAADEPRCTWFVAAIADLHNSRLVDVPDPARPCIPRGTPGEAQVRAAREFLAGLPDGAIWTPAEAVLIGLAHRYPCRR